MKNNTLVAGVLAAFTGMLCAPAQAQLPPDFPEYDVTITNGVAPGFLSGYLEIDRNSTRYGAVLDQSGYPVLYTSNTWFQSYPQANGLLPSPNSAAVGFDFYDETLTLVDSFSMIGDDIDSLDSHDVILRPNGNCLLMGNYYEYTDMSQVWPGGRPDARIKSPVFQELNPDKEVIWEWYALDHIPVTESPLPRNTSSTTVDYLHINSFYIDPLDNNLVVSFRKVGVYKISRTTGEVLWRLACAGPVNDFVFVNEHEENAPGYFLGQHSAQPTLDGSIVLFDNGNLRALDHPNNRTYSRAVEYQLDEQAMTATMVWDFRHTPDLNATSKGLVRRMANGNTFIGWGSAAQDGVVCTEVTPTGEAVYEISIVGTGNASLTKSDWIGVTSETHANVEAGQTYDAPEPAVTLTVNSLTGNPDINGLVVKKHADATRFARFPGKAPTVLATRVTIAAYGLSTVGLDAVFGTDGLQINDPSQLTVYHRPIVGQGEYTALTTSYVDTNQTLHVSNTTLGEFVFGYPDATELANPPLLLSPADQSTVNQSQAVTLKWRPNGFFQSYHLQVATDAEFTNLIVDQAGLEASDHTLASLDPGTNYYWRVNTSNYGGTGDWATNSFTTVPPMIQVATPNGGEVWQRGLDSYILWEDNLAEDVLIEVYQDGAFVQTVGTVPSSGAYEWEVDLALAAGTNYSIKISSATNSVPSDMSDSGFSIDITELTGITTTTNGAIVLEWSGSSYNMYIDFTPTLLPTAWTNIAGPIHDASWTHAAPPEGTGFYRVRAQ